MNREVYDKVYIEDNYSRQFSELRERYHDRTQQTLQGRKEESNPVPNATTVVLMNDTPDGGVTVTTADFVAFYNERHGYDRIGEMRRTIADSARRVEMKRAKEKATVVTEKKQEKASAIFARAKEKDTFRPRFSFVYASLSAALVCSLVLFFGANAALNESKAELAALESQVAATQVVENTTASATEKYDVMQLAQTATLQGGESVQDVQEEIEEGITMPGLLNALYGMGNE